MYRHHPSSSLARSLEARIPEIIETYEDNPTSFVQLLCSEFGFGDHTTLWDEFIYQKAVLPFVQRNILLQSDIPKAFNLATILGEAIFLPYIRREENPERFKFAFWSFNTIFLHLHSLVSDSFFFDTPFIDKSLLINRSSTSSDKAIAFVFKGPFSLAHSEFLHSYLLGTRDLTSPPDIYLILIDDIILPKGCEHVTVLSLAKFKTSFGKYQALANICRKIGFFNIIWVACAQSLTFYMGRSLAPNQTYWSMKYHSIILPSINKYAGLGFGGQPFIYDGQEWYRGRAFPRFDIPILSKENSLSLKSKLGIPPSSIVIGVFARSEKLHNSEYWRLFESFLTSHRHVYFVLASQKLPGDVLSLSLRLPKQQYKHLGWVNTKEVVQILDIYVDSFPRGSCNTVFEAWHCHVPTITYYSPHNLESSSLPYVIGTLGTDSPPVLLQYGVVNNLKQYANLLTYLCKSSSNRHKLASKQYDIYQQLCKSNAFSTDYTQFFLSEKPNHNLS